MHALAPERTEPGASSGRGTTGALAFAITFPTALTIAYFVALAGRPASLVQAVYAGGKLVQFAFPAVWVGWVARGLLRRPSLGGRGAAEGLAFGIGLFAVALATYGLVLAPAGVLAGAPAAAVRSKMASFGVDGVAAFVALGAFYSVLHSAAEEYYWRWFVFGALRRAVGPGWAVLGSSVAFAAHHVVVLGTFFGWSSPWTPLLAAAVGAGGAYWAWLYHRSGSLLGPWLGHLLADAAIFAIGYQLAF